MQIVELNNIVARMLILIYSFSLLSCLVYLIYRQPSRKYLNYEYLETGKDTLQTGSATYPFNVVFPNKLRYHVINKLKVDPVKHNLQYFSRGRTSGGRSTPPPTTLKSSRGDPT